MVFCRKTPFFFRVAAKSSIGEHGARKSERTELDGAPQNKHSQKSLLANSVKTPRSGEALQEVRGETRCTHPARRFPLRTESHGAVDRMCSSPGCWLHFSPLTELLPGGLASPTGASHGNKPRTVPLLVVNAF